MSSGIILIDGPDGAGKTTLAEEFAKKYDTVYLHQRYRWRNKMFAYHTSALRKAVRLASRGKLAIVDRQWPSELIYGQVYRGGSTIPHEGRFMDRVFLKHAALHILCIGKPEIIEKRHAQLSQVRHEDYITGMREVAQAYVDLAFGSTDKKYAEPRDYVQFHAKHGGFRRPDVMTYEIEEEGRNIAQFVDHAIERLNIWQGQQFELALDAKNQNLLGHLNQADILMVGDVYNVKRQKSCRPESPRDVLWPFFEYGNCSSFLADCLHQLDFREERAMWTNLNATSVASPYPSLIERLLDAKTLKVVALGDKASDGLAKRKIQHRKIPHPQFGRRFARKEFLGALREVLV